MMKELLREVLPQSIFQWSKNFYKENVTHYQRDIYSEFGEDFTAAVLLGFKRDGFYVDVGAYRPKELSVTYYFYKKLGWRGLIVEPNVAAKKLFEIQRSRDIFLNQGVAGARSELTYYEFKNPTLNSFSPQVLENNRAQLVAQKKIPVRPLSEILAEHVPMGTGIDLMNVDVEGLDLEVLKSNDWSRFTPKVLIIEDHAFNPERPMDSEIVQFIKSKGYTLKANCLISLVFVRENS